MVKVIHVYLIFEKQNHYFSSIKKVYDELDDRTLGIKQSYLYKSLDKDGAVKVTSRAIITRSHLK